MNFFNHFKKKGLDECWIWTGPTERCYNRGYNGPIGFWNGEMVHRIMYILFNGPLPPGNLVVQTCRNSLCINPTHLQRGSRSHPDWKKSDPNCVPIDTRTFKFIE